MLPDGSLDSLGGLGWTLLLLCANLAQEPVEPESREDLREPVLVGLLEGQGLVVHLHRDVAVEGNQAAAEIRLLFGVAEVLAALALDLVRVGVEVVEVAVLADQLAGGLLADQRHAGHVVDRIALQGQAIDDLPGPNPHLLLHRLAVGDLARLDVVGADVVVEQLEDVLILRADQHVDPVAGGLLGQRADDVVRLVAFQAQDRNTHRPQDLLDPVHLHRQLLRHGRPVGLVLGKDLGPERRGLAVHGHRDHVGLLLLDQPQQSGREDVRGLGRLAGRARKLLPHRGKMSRVDMGMAVNDVQGLRHFFHSMRCGFACQAHTP